LITYQLDVWSEANRKIRYASVVYDLPRIGVEFPTVAVVGYPILAVGILNFIEPTNLIVDSGRQWLLPSIQPIGRPFNS
jgi:hypothetical protein